MLTTECLKMLTCGPPADPPPVGGRSGQRDTSRDNNSSVIHTADPPWVGGRDHGARVRVQPVQVAIELQGQHTKTNNR